MDTATARAPFDVNIIGDQIENDIHEIFKPKPMTDTVLPGSPTYIEPSLNEREATHGSYSITAFHAQQFKTVARSSDGWKDLSDVQRESFDLFATKMARILSGNPDVKDHWEDIAGYAKLVAEKLK